MTTDRRTDGGTSALVELRFAAKKKLLFVHPLQDLLQTWSIDSDKLSCTNVSLGKLKRELTTVEKDPVRDCVYFGTSSGDVIKVNILTISLN